MPRVPAIAGRRGWHVILESHAERWQLDYVPCEWAQCLEELAQGRLDLMPDVAYSSERAQRFDFHRVSAVNSWSQVYMSTRIWKCTRRLISPACVSPFCRAVSSRPSLPS